eukprot:CAMPEP_0114549990 /NCGR_PEP_ID=MMETSP0114-20121206/5825_1 /TAXON_ID=31324 /ORGANISM="Goniomonas sp, Strain m" /LENGTH=101 /DNA_ID=CAMNT_0001734715 /DNA_START=117 /DNA_END=422 /DNA_ORIENTATION=+
MTTTEKLAGHEPALKVGGMRVPTKERRKSNETGDEGQTPDVLAQMGLEGPAGPVQGTNPIEVKESSLAAKRQHDAQIGVSHQPKHENRAAPQIHHIQQPRS